LAPGGRAAFSEPGQGHSSHPDTLREVGKYGVLESDVFLEDVERWGQAAGFERLTLWPLPIFGNVELAWADARKLLAGGDDVFPLEEFRQALRTNPFFFLHKSGREPDSRHPGTLRAEIRHHGPEQVRVHAGGPWELTCTVTNTGDTRWLSGPLERGGDVFLGAHLLDAWQKVQEFDYGRVRLPRDIPPGHCETVSRKLYAPERPGNYIVILDMVAEFVAWFADRGSPTVRIVLEVV